jgi:O-antigen/teichoic acid export membrane protein
LFDLEFYTHIWKGSRTYKRNLRNWWIEMDLIRAYGRAKSSIKALVLGDALRAKAMRGGAWLGTGSVGEQAARFARNMLLARILAPGAFGTMAIVLSSASLVDVLTDVGMSTAIIQSPRGGKGAYLNASWWLGLCRAVISYSIIFAAAPWISRFYGRPEISWLLRIALLSVLFNGAISPRATLAQKEMKFGRWAVITNGGGICGVIVTVILSFYMRDVWALAIGYCGENVFRFVLSYALCPGAPSLHVDWSAAKELLTFSRGIFGLAFLSLIIARADVFVLGRLYPLAGLGLYTLAVTLVTTPSTFLTSMLRQALMPALSSVQDDEQRVNRILLEVTSWILLLGMPAAVFISLSAPSLLRLAYGARYVAAAGPLSVASFVVFLIVLNEMPNNVLFAKGRPALHRRAIVITAVIMLIVVYPACKFLGPVGGQIAALLAIFVGYLYQLILLRSVTGLSLLRYASAFVPPALGSVTMLAIVLGGRGLGLTVRPAANMSLCVASCLVAYAMCASAKLRASRRRVNSYSNAKTPESSTVV